MKELIVILGPTASGKTHLAVQLASHMDGEIISADSRQFYRGMDIGTGKDLDEYVVDGKQILHHLIDIAEAGSRLNINDFHGLFHDALDKVLAKGKQPILCGGSGLYIETAVYGKELSAIPVKQELRDELRKLNGDQLVQRFENIDSRLKERVDSSTKKRMIRAIEMDEFLQHNPWPEARTLSTGVRWFGLNPPVEIRRKRISNRLIHRLEIGMIEEVETLVAQGISHNSLDYYGLEYRWISKYLLGEVSLDEMTKKLETEIHRFAKRQMTWFRRMEKKGTSIEWMEKPDVEFVLNSLGFTSTRQE